MAVLPGILKPIRGGYAPAVHNISGGQSITGFEQVVGTMQDRWNASFTFEIQGDDRVLAMRAFLIACRGRLNTVQLPAFDLARAPWRVDSVGREISPSYSRSPDLDDSQYPDSPSLRNTLIVSRVAAISALGATTLSVNVTTGSAPKPGHYFSLGTRMYAIESVTGSGPYALKVWPPLRSAAAANDVVNFTSPSCLMRLASDAEGSDAIRSLDMMRFGSVTLNFDEAI